MIPFFNTRTSATIKTTKTIATTDTTPVPRLGPCALVVYLMDVLFVPLIPSLAAVSRLSDVRFCRSFASYHWFRSCSSFMQSGSIQPNDWKDLSRVESVIR